MTRLTLTYHAKTGTTSVAGLQIPHLVPLATGLREAAATTESAEEAALLTELAEGCEELVEATSKLGHGNPVVTKEVPRMVRPPRA